VRPRPIFPSPARCAGVLLILLAFYLLLALPVSAQTPTPTPTPRIVRVVAPAIAVDAPVVEVGWRVAETDAGPQSVWETASFAVGHHRDSLSPTDGGNIVLSGHHNVEGEVFRRLSELQAGDLVTLRLETGLAYTYRVTATLILPDAGATLVQRQADAGYIAPTETERLTLVSCWPYWTNTHRVVVLAVPAVAPALPAPTPTPPAAGLFHSWLDWLLQRLDRLR
jgi:sortase A